MPHFENLDKYEGKNPRSGKREIVPIAPHSTQAADYRPRKGQSSKRTKREGLPEFKEIEFEPISVQQMEKEFKAAGKKQKRARRRGQSKSLWKRIKTFFKSLFGKKKPTSRDHNRNRRRGGPNRGKGNRTDQQRNQQGQGGNRNQRRSGRNRSRGNKPQGQGKSQGQGRSQGQGKSQGQSKPEGQKDNPGNRKPQKPSQQKNAQSENRGKEGDKAPSGENDQPNRRRRNRRNRNRSRNPGQKRDSGNDASQ